MLAHGHIGADCLKKPHHIVTLRFIEVVKDHAICLLDNVYKIVGSGVVQSHICSQISDFNDRFCDFCW